MDLSHAVASNKFVAKGNLGHTDAEDLFTSAGGNRRQQSVAQLLFRRKLISVSVCGARDPEELHAMPPVPSMHPCVDTLCTRVARFRNIAFVFVYISCPADLSEDKMLAQCLRVLLRLDRVVVYFMPDLNRTPDNARDEGPYEGICGELTFFAEELPRANAAFEGPGNLNDQLLQRPGCMATWCSLRSLLSAVHTSCSGPATTTQAQQLPDRPLYRPSLAHHHQRNGRCASNGAIHTAWLRRRSSSMNGGPVFHNVPSGVPVFRVQPHVTEGRVNGNAAALRITEDAIRRGAQD